MPKDPIQKLRVAILDHLSRAEQPRTIQQIAESMNQPVETIRVAVADERFIVDGDLVVIKQDGN